MINTDKVKELVSLSTTIDEADKIIENYIGFDDVKSKITFLKTAFGCDIVFRKNDNNTDELLEDYYALLATVIDLEEEMFEF